MRITRRGQKSRLCIEDLPYWMKYTQTKIDRQMKTEDTLAASPSMSGKTALITGATSGIGLSAAHSLAELGANILVVGRSAERCHLTAASLQRLHPSITVRSFTADLASQRQVRHLAYEVRQYLAQKTNGKLDVLVNNAGTITSWYTATEDGYETVFAVNHLAPFLLTHELLPALQAAESARILTVSSKSHRNMRIFWGDVMLRRIFNPLLAYKQSKLANVLFTAEFNRRYSSTSVMRAFAIDPGLVNTEIGMKNNSGLVYWIWNLRRKQGASPDLPAKTIALVASKPGLDPANGLYWKNLRAIPPSEYALRSAEAHRLWQLSERLCGIQGSSTA